MQHRYLFLDLHHITRIEGLYRRMHQPRRHPENPILRGENPWETVASLYGIVLYDPQDSLITVASMGHTPAENSSRLNESTNPC